MENVTLNVIYEEIKKLETLVYKMDQKVENFMGLEIINENEMKKLKQISTEMKTKSKSLEQIAQETDVILLN